MSVSVWTLVSLRVQAKKDLRCIRNSAPGIVILWSDIIPHWVWRGALSCVRIDRARKRINQYLGRVVQKLGGAAIRHLELCFD